MSRCYVAVGAWDAHLRAHRPDLRLITFLDDRIVLGSSAAAAADLQVALDLTAQIAAAFGPDLNLDKSMWDVFQPRAHTVVGEVAGIARAVGSFV